MKKFVSSSSPSSGNLSFSLSIVHFICVLFHLICKLTELYTKERQDTKAIAGETSDLDTKNLESTEATESKHSVALSQLDTVDVMIIQDSFPEEVDLNVTVEADGVIEGTEESKKTAIGITTYS